MFKNHPQWSRYAWLAFVLAVIGLSFASWRAGAISLRLPNAPQLASAVELNKETGFAADALPAIPSLFTETLTSSLPSLIQPPAGCGASFAQPAGSPVAAGSSPQSVAVGDFNLDGKPDLAVANGGSNNVTILLGNGSGGFAPAAGSPVGVEGNPVSVAVGDFNLDGKPDLAVANQGSNNVTILLGNGSGGFAPAASSPISAGNFPNFIAVADFNLDGKPDLAVANTIATVTIRIGDGNGGFIASGPPIGVSDPESIAVGDYNLDGKPDLAVSQGLQIGKLRVFRGNGSGLFSPALGSPFNVSPISSSVKFGDFNLDGRPDLAVASIANNNVTILLNDVTGFFVQAAGSPVDVGTNPTSLSVGDFNLDGKPDIATANNGSNDITILQGDGTGGFVTAMGSHIGAGNGPQHLATGDFDLDGKPDFAVANSTSNNVTVQLNTCPAQPCSGIAFSRPTGSPVGVGSGPRSVAIGDFNLDGKPDLAVVNIFSSNVSILLGNGIGGFSSPTNLSVPPAPLSVAVGDFNLDGRLDLAVTVASQDFNVASILLGNGMGGFSGPTNFAVGIGPRLVVVADFNSDGRPDLATANGDSANVSVLLGDGMGGFSAMTNFAVGVGPNWIVVGDFNLDGKLDLAVANSSSTTVSILLGNGMGSLSGPINFTVGGNPGTLAVGDFNSDGRLDLVTGNGNFTVSILIGNGTGGFSAPTDFAAGGGINRVAAGDFTLDGKLDLAVANIGSNTLSILVGNGAGAFSAPTSFTVGVNPFSVTVGDFNLDGKPDLAVPNVLSNNVTILLNTCTSNTPPTINCPASISVGGDAGQNSASVPFTVTATGIPAPTVTCRVGNSVITSPHVFPVGTTTVNCTASNGVVPGATCSFTVTVNRVSGTANDPLACTGPGGKVQATLNISNDGQVNQNVISNTSFTNLIGVPGSCSVTPNIGTCTVTTSGVGYTATLAPGTTVTITYLTQVNDLAPPQAQVCTNNSVSFNGGQPLNFSACDVVDCPAAGPGGIFPAASEKSDQKAGSVLIYNIYTSSTDPNRQNTRINLTNTHSQLPTFVHMFFVAEGCAVADSYICLTANQTASLLASDLDPGTTGYLVVVAVDALGCPTAFNHLIGDEYVKFASGHAANLGAEAFAALPGGLPACDGNSVTAAIAFDGISYNRAPRVLALSNIGSRADGNDTMLILNRIGGNLGIGTSSLGTLFGILYDDAENGQSFQITGNCQLRNSLTNNFPRTVPRFETLIPTGRTGWVRLYSQNDIGMTGAAINFNPNIASSAGAFNQGHNLHALTLSATNIYTIPIFPPSC